MEAIFRKAMHYGSPVMIMYCSKNGIVTKRLISVEHVRGEWIEGFCHLRQAYRRFNKANILAVLPADQEYLQQRKLVY